MLTFYYWFCLTFIVWLLGLGWRLRSARKLTERQAMLWVLASVALIFFLVILGHPDHWPSARNHRTLTTARGEP